MNGVTIGGYHSYDDLSLVLVSKEIGNPEAKKMTVDIEGADGVIDFTDFFGEAKFGNRNLKFVFSTIVSQSDFPSVYSVVLDAINGKRLSIYTDDDADYYYMGRVSVSSFTNEKNIGHITIDCDCDPYKYKMNETVVTKQVSDSLSITLTNSRKRVVPQITTTASMNISFGTYSGTFSAGTFIIPQLELTEGDNNITVTGTGRITFRYQEGRL